MGSKLFLYSLSWKFSLPTVRGNDESIVYQVFYTGPEDGSLPQEALYSTPINDKYEGQLEDSDFLFPFFGGYAESHRSGVQDLNADLIFSVDDLAFGEVTGADFIEREVFVQNTGARDVEIGSVEPSFDVRTNLTSTTIKAGETLGFVIAIRPSDFDLGELSASVEVEHDGDSRSKVIMISAKVVGEGASDDSGADDSVGDGGDGSDGSGSGGGSGGLVRAYALLAANVFALTAAFGVLSRGSEVQVLIASIEQLEIVSGKSITQVGRDLQAASGFSLDLASSLRSVSLATSAGFNAKQIEELGRVAKNASVSLGRDLADGLDRIFRGVIKVEPELLDEIGLFVRVNEAASKYAADLGISVSSLTDFQKRQAFANEALEQGRKKFQAFEDVEVSPLNQLAASLQDIANNAIGVLLERVNPVLKFFQENQQSHRYPHQKSARGNWSVADWLPWQPRRSLHLGQAPGLQIQTGSG
jgi:hypothetical protein